MTKYNKDKTIHKERTLFGKLIFPMIVVMLIQLGIGYGMFSLSGTMDKLKTERYNGFYEIVANRSEKIQDLMMEKRELAKAYKARLEEEIASLLTERNQTIADLYADSRLDDEIMQELTDEMEEMLKGSLSSGVFLVLEGNGVDNGVKCGYYLRNSRPGMADTRYFSVLRGSEALLEQVEFATNVNWRSEFRIDERPENDFYNKMEQLVEKHGSLNSGYWSPVYCMYGDDQQIITYTVPLVDQEGKFYGVLGIEMSEQMFLDEMAYNEISSSGSASYYLIHRCSSNENYLSMVSFSNSGKGITDKKGYINYSKYDNKDNMYLINTKLAGNYVGTIAGMELYIPQSPYAEEQWALLGVQNENDLLKTYHRLVWGLLVAMVLMVLLGGLEVWYICMRVTTYLRQMMYDIHNSSPKEQLVIGQADIKEIDQLADTIRQLEERSTSSTKLVEIIEMTGILVGAIELRESEDFIFCTWGAAQILEFHHIDRENRYISRKAFDVEIEVLRKNLVKYEGEEDTYQMTSRSGANKWIRVRLKNKDKRTLVAVQDVTAEILEKQKIEYERDYDILTRLLNRTAFRAKLGQLLKRGNLGVAAVVMMDLDNLKFFNDTYGHEYGDKYIREAAVVLSTMNQYGALVARMSGDEFLMFIYGYSDKEEIRALVYDVHKRLKESCITVPTGENIRLRASAGIAWYPDDATYLDELIKYADFAMYETKGNKKGNIKEFDKEKYEKDAVLFTGKEELNRLFEEEGMVRYIFQPIVEAATGEVFGYEALMRPQIDSLRSPEDVMRLAKAQSKLYQVERVTWMAALEAVDMQQKPEDTFRIFINSVPNHVLEEEDTQELEKKYHHLLNRVVIEIIENEQTDKSCMETKCEWAVQHDASIALDDFGTGYSNESTLLYINPKYVKLDMSIISNIHKDESRQKIVHGLLDYTKSHGMKVIAEGIDSYEEMQTLIRLGVDYMQGWYLARGKFKIADIAEELKEQIRECARESQLVGETVTMD